MRRRAHAGIERRPLVGVLAVAQVADLLVRVSPRRREALPVHAHGKPARDRHVVAGGAGKGLGGQAGARLERQPPVTLAQLGEHSLVVGGIDHDGGKGAVLGGRPDHRRAADVDVLDDLRLVRVFARDGLLERVQVHAHEIHLLDALLGRLAQVRVLVAARQQTRVQPRDERLHPPVHDLGEAREVLDRPDSDPRAGQLVRGAAGRDDLHAQLLEPAGEVDDPPLVRDRQQRPAYADLTGLGPLDSGRPVGRRPAIGEHLAQPIPRPSAPPAHL